MVQPFKFPPPPPPPPRKEPPPPPDFAPSNYVPSYNRGNRGRGNGLHRGRGRGDALRGRGWSGRGRGRDHGTNHCYDNISTPNPGLLQNRNQDGHSFQLASPSPYPGQKRSYSAALNQLATSSPRPQAAPAVPSFGGDILPPPAPQSNSSAAPKKKPRTRNQLGLTPASQDHESSADEDEEGRLVNNSSFSAMPNSSVLQFEYRGQTATLRTAAEIAAWIAERKKNYPTAAKVEAARREAQERKDKWEESKKERAELQMLQGSEREKARQEELRQRALQSVRTNKAAKEGDSYQTTNKKERVDETIKMAQKAEKLKRKLQKAQRDAREAEEALARMQWAGDTSQEDRAEGAGSARIQSESPGPGSLATPAAETCGPKPNAPDELAKLKVELLKEEDVASSSASATSSDLSVSDLYDSETDAEEDEATSSSGSDTPSHSQTDSAADSDSNADASPEELTSKRTAPERVPPPPRIDPSKHPPSQSSEDKARPRTLCRNMLRGGRCQFGHRCRYSHDISGKRDQGMRDGDGRGQKGGTRGQGQEGRKGRTGRKGLYQVMVEKEVDEERRAVVEVIMAMGERGMLEEADVEKGSITGEERGTGHPSEGRKG